MTCLALAAAGSLPPPVERWVETAALERFADVKTIGTIGTGRVRIGRLPWLPIDHRTVHRLGRDEVRDIRLRVGPVPVLPVLDAYVDGAGLTRIGRVPTVGPAVDQAAFLAMWAEALWWPFAWRRTAGVAWEAVDERHARLHVPFGAGIEVADVAFDRDTSLPRTYEVDRCKGQGRKVRWRVEWSDAGTLGAITAPTRARAAWADEPGPWYDASFERIVLDAPVDRTLDRARRAIARARRR